MKKLQFIAQAWQALMIATIIATVLFLCSSCGESIANNENIYEDEFCLAEGQGIVLQEMYFINGEPYLYGEPACLTEEAQVLIDTIFEGKTNIWEHPIAAVCWKTSWGQYIIDLD